MKPFILLLTTMLVTGCVTQYWDEFLTVEVNGTTITIPDIGYAVPKAIRNSLIGSKLTAHEIKTLESALPIVMRAVRFTLYENHTTEALRKQFSDAEITLIYQSLADKLIEDRRGGINDIRHWDVTSTDLAFTLYCSMRNEADDGYGIESKDYDIKFRYYFTKDEQGEWQFVKNKFVEFAHY